MKKEEENKEDFEEDITVEEEDESQNPLDLVKKLREKLKVALAQKQEYLNGWQKDKADFINLRKRDEESKVEFIKFANQKIILEIIPIVDSFEQAFSSNWESVSPEWKRGVESIYNQLIQVLNNNGVKKFNPEKEDFNPTLHEAVSMEKTGEKNMDHKILRVLQAGYMLDGKILRPAKVVVGEYIGK